MGSYAVKHELAETGSPDIYYKMDGPWQTSSENSQKNIVYFVLPFVRSGKNRSCVETVGQYLLVAGGKDMGGHTAFILSLVKIYR